MGQRRRSHRVSIASSQGALAAVVDEPAESEPKRWALLTHGFGSFKEFKPLARISAALAEAEWGVVRFDFSGLGRSEGDFSDTSFYTQQADIRAAHQWMQEQSEAPQLVVGHSLGGAALLSLAPELPATHLATLGAPSDGKHLADALEQMQPLLKRHAADVVIAGKRRQITREMLRVLREVDFSNAVTSAPQSLLLIHAANDEMVSRQHAERIAAWAAENATIRDLPGADHLLSREADIEKATQWILHWAAFE